MADATGGTTIEAGSNEESPRKRTFLHVKEQPRRSGTGIIGGHRFEIWIASFLLTVPMLVLSAILLALVHIHQMPDKKSSYSYKNGTGLPLGPAYYINYSAVTLAYIASLSSTLATLLISAAMVLFSYSLARNITQESDQSNASRLPSPYQLELLIRIIDGRIMALWSYGVYVFGSKKRRTAIVPIVWRAATMLLALVLLALLVGLADLWLHLYHEVRPEQPPEALIPGRRVPQMCLDHPDGFENRTIPVGCIAWQSDAARTPVLVNNSEFIKTAGNQADVNRIYLSDGQAVLGPAKTPSNVDYLANSFSSQKTCRTVTYLCGAKSMTGRRNPPLNDTAFACNTTRAGLNMSANFYFFRPGVYLGHEPEVDSEILGFEGNTLTPNLKDYGFGFQYFTDALMQKQHEVADHLFGLNPDSPQLFWAFVFNLDVKLSSEDLGNREIPIDNEGTQNPSAELDLVSDTQGGPMGILSCATKLSEVTYSYANDSLNVISTRTPSKNASIPFVNGISSSWGHALLRQGLEQSFVGAKTSQDFAAGFARVYDRVAMTVPAGIMVPIPAFDVFRRIQTTVARVPKAPFVALIILNLFYAAAGVALTITALLAVFLGKGVRDAQARLSVPGVIAESFESPALGDDAKEVDDLYAERRGLATRKIALASTAGGGRGYRQVVVQGEENAQRLLK